MKFFNYLLSRKSEGHDYAKKFKEEFERLFEGESVEIYDNLLRIVTEWQRDSPNDENLVYADLIVNLNSYDREKVLRRINSSSLLKPVDKQLHGWFISCVFVILVVYLNDDLRQYYLKAIRDPSLSDNFSQMLSQRANEEEFCRILLENSSDDEELAINTRILHVTVFSRYAKYINFTCMDFAEEFEKIIFGSANSKSQSNDVITEFRNIADVWKIRCPDDANMACGYVTAYINDLNDDELKEYVDLAENGAAIDESRHFVMSKAMSGALKVKNNDEEINRTYELEGDEYAKRFRQLYEKIFNGEVGDGDDKEMADLLFSWGLNYPDDANAVLARTLMFHDALHQRDIDENIKKLKYLKPIDKEAYPWLLSKTLFKVLDEDSARAMMNDLLDGSL